MTNNGIRKILCTLWLVLLSAALASALSDDTAKIPSCRYCGMDREKFAHSRMLVEYDDGSITGTCSMRCMATELANAIDKTPRGLKVGDYNTHELIDAESAFWVIGGDKAGVMSSRAKWAFAKKADAEEFIKANKGNPATFEESMRTAYGDLYEDTLAIRERRKARKMKAMEGK